MKKKLILITLLFSIFASACSLTTLPISTSTAGPTATETPLPTFTPFPTATPTPTPVPEVRIDQAEDNLFLGDYEGALEEYQLAFLQASTDDVRAASLAGMGYSHYLLGNYQLSIDAFTTVLEVYPEGYHLLKSYYYLAEAHKALGDYLKAAAYYEQYLQVKPGVLDDYIQELRGDVLKQAGEIPAAISAYQSAIDASSMGSAILVEIKLARTYADSGDLETAIRMYADISTRSDNDYIKAQMNFLSGQAYLFLGQPDAAYPYFQDSLQKYPRSYDTYSGLEALVLAGQPVGELESGLVYYFAGKYGNAVNAFRSYLKSTPEHNGTAHHYLAFSLLVLDDIEGAIEEWKAIVNDHPGDQYWEEAWDEWAYTLWAYLDRYDQAAQTYLDFVNRVPSAPEAPQYLYWAARLYEQNLKLELAAQTWERLIVEYPANDLSLRGMFLAGICYYRLGDLARAQTAFQRLIILASDTESLSGAHLWLGKIQMQQGNIEKAHEEWTVASGLDPTGYYSERAAELLEGKKPLQIDPESYSLEFDLEKDKGLAEAWLRSNFAIPEETDLHSLGILEENIHIRRGNAYWELGLYNLAGAEFDLVRLEITQDPVSNYRLLDHLLDLGFYKHAILLSRQILDLANFDDTATLLAPIYFNRIRFGIYFSDLVLPAAEKLQITPLILFSQIRQESFFEWYVGSTAGARGLMQLMPATGQQMADAADWPAGYTATDLYRPIVNVELGTRYLQRQLRYFGSANLYVALAAYNAGPSNAENWYRISGDDPDLFLEVIRFAETRNYLIYIAEFTHIYEQIYAR